MKKGAGGWEGTEDCELIAESPGKVFFSLGWKERGQWALFRLRKSTCGETLPNSRVQKTWGASLPLLNAI